MARLEAQVQGGPNMEQINKRTSSRERRPTAKWQSFAEDTLTNTLKEDISVKGGNSSEKPRQYGTRPITSKQAAQWKGRLQYAKGWLKEKSRYPTEKSLNKVERSLAQWLYTNLPGQPMFRLERWDMLNEALGQGWENVAFPRWGRGQSGVPKGTISPVQAAQWEGSFTNAKEWVRRNGRYPKKLHSSNRRERAVANWLSNNLPGMKSHRSDRWARLNDAFGNGWEFEFCPGFGQGASRTGLRPEFAARWDGWFADAKEWRRQKGTYPKKHSSSKKEAAIATWLYRNLPGQESWRPDRWQLLNGAFGNGWETDFCPGFGQGKGCNFYRD